MGFKAKRLIGEPRAMEFRNATSALVRRELTGDEDRGRITSSQFCQEQDSRWKIADLLWMHWCILFVRHGRSAGLGQVEQGEMFA